MTKWLDLIRIRAYNILCFRTQNRIPTLTEAFSNADKFTEKEIREKIYNRKR